MALTTCVTVWSTGSSWPATVRPSTCEEPASVGLPSTQLPDAVALESLTPSSGLGGGGRSAARACVMSTSPMPGTGIVVAGIGAAPAGTPIDRPATSPVARAVCWAGWAADPSSVVRADRTLACSGSGSAGRFSPPLAALQVVAPALAVTGEVMGGPDSALAEQFQPAAGAGADMTSTPAAIAASTQTILRTKDLHLWDRSTARNDGGRRIKRSPEITRRRTTRSARPPARPRRRRSAARRRAGRR